MKILKNSNFFLIKKLIKIKKNIFFKNIKLLFEKKFYKKNYKLILVNHALTGSHHFHGVFIKNLSNLGWWSKIIDEKFLKLKLNFICFNNILSNFGSTNNFSINPLNNKIYGNYFPRINIKHFIKLQKYIILKLNIKKIYITIGGSFGALQSLLWSIIYPNKIFITICIAGVNKMTLLNKIKNKINKLIPNYINNIIKKNYLNYNIKCIKSLKLIRIINNLSYLSKYDIKLKIFKNFYKRNYKIYKNVQNLSKYFYFKSNKFYKVFNIKSYIYYIKIINKFNIYNFKINKIKNKNFFFIYFKNDERFCFKNSKNLLKFFTKKNFVNFKNMEIFSGHDSFLLKDTNYNNLISIFIKNYIKEL